MTGFPSIMSLPPEDFKTTGEWIPGKGLQLTTTVVVKIPPKVHKAYRDFFTAYVEAIMKGG